MFRIFSIVSAVLLALFSSVFFLFVYYCSHAFFAIRSSNYGLFGSALTELSPSGPFLVGDYIWKYKGYLDSSRLASVLIDGQHRFVYGSCIGVNWATAVGARIKRWADWSGRGAALCIASMAVPLHMPFHRCTKELPYVLQLATVIVFYTVLRDKKFITHSSNYI